MSTRSTTAIIDRRDEQKTIVTYYRHHDGYPGGHGQDLVDLLVELDPYEPEQLTRAIDERWQGAERPDLGEYQRDPCLERTKSHDSHGDSEYRYDVFFEDSDEAPIRVECRNGYGDGWGLDDSDEWQLISQQFAARPVSRRPQPAKIEPGPGRRLSDLSERTQ